MDELPHNSKDPEIVVYFDESIKLKVTLTNNEVWTDEDYVQLNKCKHQYLEEKLGYPLIKFIGYPRNKYEIDNV